MDARVQIRHRAGHLIIPLPYRAHGSEDVGYDITYTGGNRVIWPFQCIDLDTLYDIKVEDGWWLNIKARSSTFKHRRLFVHEGVIDPGYAGPLSILIFNPTFWPRLIRNGDRLAQLVLHKQRHAHFHLVKRLTTTYRGSRGFGSSGGL